MMDINPKDYFSENILSEEELVKKLEQLRREGKKIGFCSGSFDVLHPGHIDLLISAKKMCDVLVVGIARDSFSINKNSESGRPIFPQDLRAFMISQLKPVDFVFFERPSKDNQGSEENILLVKPHFNIRGPDYSNESNPGIIRDKKIMSSWGGEMRYVQGYNPGGKKLSTTDIIKHIKEKVK